jgi:hypothetical protein
VPRIRRAALVTAIWGVATAFALAFAEFTRVGPVLVIFSRGHGMHVGDLVVLLLIYASAFVLTRRVMRRS